MARNTKFEAARVRKGLTHRQLAKLVGLDESSILGIEGGWVHLDLQLKLRIAEVLKKPTSELFTW